MHARVQEQLAIAMSLLLECERQFHKQYLNQIYSSHTQSTKAKYAVYSKCGATGSSQRANAPLMGYPVTKTIRNYFKNFKRRVYPPGCRYVEYHQIKIPAVSFRNPNPNLTLILNLTLTLTLRAIETEVYAVQIAGIIIWRSLHTGSRDSINYELCLKVI